MTSFFYAVSHCHLSATLQTMSIIIVNLQDNRAVFRIFIKVFMWLSLIVCKSAFNRTNVNNFQFHLSRSLRNIGHFYFIYWRLMFCRVWRLGSNCCLCLYVDLSVLNTKVADLSYTVVPIYATSGVTCQKPETFTVTALRNQNPQAHVLFTFQLFWCMQRKNTGCFRKLGA